MNEAIEKKLTELEDNLSLGDWIVDEHGVTRNKEIIRGGKVVATETETASPIPVLPTAILENVDTNTEKIEISYFKHNKWQSFITERSVTANRNGVIRLADKGLEVNSDNAGMLVRYIADVVASSLYCIQHKPAKSVMGWIEGEFMPYTDTIKFDGEDQFKHLFKAISHKGKLDDWIKFVGPLRSKSLDLRLCMAAAFASPLIEIIGENPFVFHLWGGTGSGKTVALLVSMSIFGDPSMGKLTRTMNMTQNSMLSTAAFLRNLPFAGDELQTIKSRWTNYDNLIMCITEGVDRGRMSYDQIKETKAWKCSFLFSGEEPCIKQASGGGAKNRVIEVECKDKIIENGNLVANYVRTHYGCAGKPYTDYLKTVSDDISGTYNDLFNQILSTTKTTDKQAGAMAMMLTADQIASTLFWPDEPELTIDRIRPYLCNATDIDVSERAYQFVLNSVAENRNNFTRDAKQIWGELNDDFVYINKNVLNRIMADEGFDFDAVKAKWAEKSYLLKNPRGKFMHFRSISGVQAWYVQIALQSGVEYVKVDDDEGLPM